MSVGLMSSFSTVRFASPTGLLTFTTMSTTPLSVDDLVTVTVDPPAPTIVTLMSFIPVVPEPVPPEEVPLMLPPPELPLDVVLTVFVDALPDEPPPPPELPPEPLPDEDSEELVALDVVFVVLVAELPDSELHERASPLIVSGI